MECKKEFRRRVNILCALMFLCLCSNLIVSYIYYYLSYFDIPVGFWADTFAIQTAYMFLYAIPIFLIAYRACHEKLTDVLPVRTGNIGQKALAVVGAFGAAMVLNICYNYVLAFLEGAGMEIAEWDSGMIMPQTGAEWIGYGVMVCVLPALLEELVFRGAVLGCLKKINTPAAIIVSALLFGLYHGTIEQIPVTFGLGLLLGWLCIRFDSVTVPIVFHFFNNMIATVQTFLLETAEAETATVIIALMDTVLLVVGIAAFCVFVASGQAKFERQDKTESGEIVLSGKKAFAATVSAAVFWVFAAYTVAETLLTNYILTK